MFFYISVYGQQIYLIPQISLNVSAYDFSETISNSDNQRFSPGFTAGVGLNLSLDELQTFSLHPEINYSFRTSKIDRPIATGQGTSSSVSVLQQQTTMHYIEVPFLARFDFGINTKYYINIGPSFAYALAGKEKQQNDSAPGTNYNRSADFANRFNRTDWSAVIGGGMEFPVNDGFINLDARFSWGFNTLYKSRETNVTNTAGGINTVRVGPEGKNRLFMLGIGYALPLN